MEVFSTVVPAFREPAVIRPINRRDHIAMMLEPELEEFAQSIIDERAPSITMSDARRVLRILDTIFETNKGT